MINRFLSNKGSLIGCVSHLSFENLLVAIWEQILNFPAFPWEWEKKERVCLTEQLEEILTQPFLH